MDHWLLIEHLKCYVNTPAELAAETYTLAIGGNKIGNKLVNKGHIYQDIEKCLIHMNLGHSSVPLYRG